MKTFIEAKVFIINKIVFYKNSYFIYLIRRDFLFYFFFNQDKKTSKDFRFILKTY